MSKTGIPCYRSGGCGPYEMYSCNECPASKSDYLQRDIKDYPPYLDYPKPRKPTTNADRIRAMSDEELAVWMNGIIKERYIEVTCDGWLSWLKSPVNLEAGK